jgi:hypothetical protein
VLSFRKPNGFVCEHPRHLPSLTILWTRAAHSLLKNSVFLDVTPFSFVRIDVSEESIASIFKMIGIGELRTTLAVTSNRSTLRRNLYLFMEVRSSSETSIITRVTRNNIPEDGTLHTHRRVNLKFCILCCLFLCWAQVRSGDIYIFTLFKYYLLRASIFAWKCVIDMEITLPGRLH